MAALYWRVKGQGKKAIDCLRQALHYAPHQMKVSKGVREYLCVLLSGGHWLHAVSVRHPHAQKVAHRGHGGRGGLWLAPPHRVGA